MEVQKRPTGDIDTGSLLKILTASNEMMEKLDKVPIHNLAEERSVGLVNYGIKIKGKDIITTVYPNVILNKSFDLTCCLLMHWPTLRHGIQVIRFEWNDKMKKYKEKGYSENEALNIRTEEQKLADMEILKIKQNPPGPFTRSNEISDYLGDNNDAVKNKQLYIEVRLAKKLSLKPSSSLFRLKRAGRNLTSDEYGKNLISYLDNSHSQTSITITDLQKVFQH